MILIGTTKTASKDNLVIASSAKDLPTVVLPGLRGQASRVSISLQRTGGLS
jgi:hypothetical protein